MRLTTFITATFALLIGLYSTSALALDRRIRIHNESNKRIVELYASPIDAPRWDFNMINTYGKIIRGGETRVADIDDGTGYCRYDLKAVRADGNVYEKYDVNVCTVTDWYLHAN